MEATCVGGREREREEDEEEEERQSLWMRVSAKCVNCKTK